MRQLELLPAVWAQAGAAMEGLRHELTSQPFSRIYAFGDGLADTGDLFQLSGGHPPHRISTAGSPTVVFG